MYLLRYMSHPVYRRRDIRWRWRELHVLSVNLCRHKPILCWIKIDVVSPLLNINSDHFDGTSFHLHFSQMSHRVNGLLFRSHMPRSLENRILSKSNFVTLCRKDAHHYRRTRGSEKQGKREGMGGIPRFPIVLKSVEAKGKLYELSVETKRERKRSNGGSFDVFVGETKWPAHPRENEILAHDT